MGNAVPGLVYYVLDATRLTQRVKIGFTTNLVDPARVASRADGQWFARGWRGVPTTTQPIAEAVVAVAAVDLDDVVPVQF